MRIFDWNRYSLPTRFLSLAIGATLILGFAFGDELLTELGIPERKHLTVFGLALLLPTLWLLARMKVEDQDRPDGE